MANAVRLCGLTALPLQHFAIMFVIWPVRRPVGLYP